MTTTEIARSGMHPYVANRKTNILDDMLDAGTVFYKLQKELGALTQFRSIYKSWLTEVPSKERCDALVAALTDEKLVRLMDAAIKASERLLAPDSDALKMKLYSAWAEKLANDKDCLRDALKSSDTFTERMEMGVGELRLFKMSVDKLLKLRDTPSFTDELMDSLPEIIDRASKSGLWLHSSARQVYDLFYGRHMDGPHPETRLARRFDAAS
jgi:hypothetical protein